MVDIVSWIDSNRGQLLIAGALGAATSVVMEWSGYVSAFRRLFVGTVASYYLTPISGPLLGWPLEHLQINSEQSVSVAGYITGVAGVFLVEILLILIRARKRDISGGQNDKN